MLKEIVELLTGWARKTPQEGFSHVIEGWDMLAQRLLQSNQELVQSNKMLQEQVTELLGQTAELKSELLATRADFAQLKRENKQIHDDMLKQNGVINELSRTIDTLRDKLLEAGLGS